MLDSQVQGVLVLVRAALTGEVRPLPEDFDLEKAYDAILKHNIAVMALEGAVKCGLPKSDPTVRKLFAAAFRAIACVEAQDRAAAQVFAAFEAAGIDFMPVKGALLRDLYPKREYRSMGDMDVLVRLEQYDRIREIMVGLGFDAKYESDHELVWKRKDLFLELHKHLIPSYNIDYYSYFGDGWQLAQNTGTSRHGMREEDHFIFVFAHFAKHYRDGGVGMRQMCDLWLMRQAYPDMDEAYIRTELKKLELLAFHDYVMQTLDVWFGAGKHDAHTELITQMVFDSGCFGTRVSHALAAGVRLESVGDTVKTARYKNIARSIFLPLQDMQMQYPVLKQLPVLLPVMWVCRWLRVAVKTPRKIRRQIERFRMMQEEDVLAYRDALVFVGLKYGKKQ